MLLVAAIFLVLLFTIWSCAEDESFLMPIEEEPMMVTPEQDSSMMATEPDTMMMSPGQTVMLEETRMQNSSFLTADDTKIWRIERAFLTHGNNQIDISDNFNTVDDEFVFSYDGGLIWRKGFDIKTDASNSSEALLDKYVSAIETQYSFQDGSGSIVEADFGSCVFEIMGPNAVSATITNDDSSVLSFELQEKEAGDYKTTPTGPLGFSTAFQFISDDIVCCAPGMIGSYSENQLYIVTKYPRNNTEIVMGFDPMSGDQTKSYIFDQRDFVSKQLHIIDNQLIVAGGQYINTYNTDLVSDPESHTHDKQLTRFGISVLDNDMYLIGGDVHEIESNKIFKWSLETNTLSEFATLPEPKSGARGTIVNEHLYVFGGSQEFFGTDASNKIYKVSIEDPIEIEEFEMNRAMDFTFVQKYENLIFVAGQIIIGNDGGYNPNPFTYDSSIGVFNTIDNSYEEIETNLSNPEDSYSIHQMSILNDKIYILYGENNRSRTNGALWDVMVADLKN